MNNRFQASNNTPNSMDWGRASITPAQRNQVLRNTYMLLTISMIPTILGAFIGLKTGIASGLTGGVGLAVFLIGSFGFMFAIEKTKNSGAGVAFLLGFTFFMGVMLSRMLSVILGLGNGEQIILSAGAATAGIFFTMAIVSSVIKRDLSGLGKWLFVGALVIFFGAIVNAFIGSGVGMFVISTLVVGIFSLYMLYDLKRIVDGGETNYISATLALYLDIYNVFQGLLAIFGLGGSND